MPSPQRYRRREAVMGTVVTFDVRGASAAASPAGAVARAVRWLHWVDATFSTYRPDSEICRIDRGELSPADAHPLVADVLDRCAELQKATGGYFDARAGGSLDPSGWVKGWALGEASALLSEAGWTDHLVDGGGDVCLRGQPGPGQRWHVAIAHPFQRDAYCAVLSIDAGAVATSGTYERGFHVVDPHRGVPAVALASVTVVGPDLALADAYATTALAMGEGAPAWLATLERHEAMTVDARGALWATPGFADLRVLPASAGPRT